MPHICEEHSMSDMTVEVPNGSDLTGSSQEDILQKSLTPGARLRMRRTELTWSVEQAANQLNLAPRQIQALECDNYAALPGMASVRGFVRAYAKLLKLDPAPLLDIIAEEGGASNQMTPLRRALPATPFSEQRLSSPNFHRLPSKPTFVVLSALLLAAGIFVAQKRGWISLLPQSLSAKMDMGLSFLSAAPSSHESGMASESWSDTSTTVLTPNVNGLDDISAGIVNTATDISMAESAMKQVGAVPMKSAMTVAVSSAAESTAVTNDMLVLKLREESWIDIRRQDNSVLISGLLKPGTIETFKVTGPLTLIVGNAAGVDATLRGTRLDLMADKKSNVARLSLK
jgi:cytoskeleton protein RodZ